MREQHLHGIDSGLRHRLAAIGARVAEQPMTGSADRGPLVGHVPEYTITLSRADGRTLTFPLSTGQAPYEPTAFDLVDTLLCNAGLHVDEGMGGKAAADEMDSVRRFLEGPDCWEDWLRHTDRDPGRQDDYDEVDPDGAAPTVCPQCGATDAEGEGKLDGLLEPYQDAEGSGYQCLNPECQWLGTPDSE